MNALERIAFDSRVVRGHETSLADARATRDESIRQARGAGHTLREIGEAAGLHHTAIAKIVREKEDSR